MPKETFFNLQEDKRKRIIDAAVDEFAVYDFNDATVNRIVKNASIAKGSFYQYFEDKYDLFKYIIDEIAFIKMKYLEPAFENMDEENFFDVLGKMYKNGLKFSLDYPKYSGIGLGLMKSSDAELLKRIYGEYDGQVNGFLEPLIKRAIEKKEVRDDIDVEFLSYMLGQLSLMIADYYFKVKNNNIIDEAYLAEINIMLKIFKEGVEVK